MVMIGNGKFANENKTNRIKTNRIQGYFWRSISYKIEKIDYPVNIFYGIDPKARLSRDDRTGFGKRDGPGLIVFSQIPRCTSSA